MAKAFIDYGHYKSDSGAVGNGLREVDINIKYGKYLADELIRHGVTVKIGQGGSLAARSQEANAWGCDVFISVHVNAGGGDGFEVYHYYSSSKGKSIATKVYNQVVNIDKLNNGRGVKEAGFAVIKNTNAPAILTEVAFIDTKDIQCIDEDKEQKAFGVSIAKGILSYLGIDYNSTGQQTPNPQPDKTPQPSVDNWVKRLQKELNVQGFRDKNGNKLAEDGILGELTISAMPVIKKGSKGNITKLVQELLVSKGYNTGGVDGIAGDKTRTAIINYQQRRNIIADGCFGGQSLRMCNN